MDKRVYLFSDYHFLFYSIDGIIMGVGRDWLSSYQGRNVVETVTDEVIES